MGLVCDLDLGTAAGNSMVTLVPEVNASVAYLLHMTDSGAHTHFSGAAFTSNSYRVISFSGSYLTN